MILIYLSENHTNVCFDTTKYCTVFKFKFLMAVKNFFDLQKKTFEKEIEKSSSFLY